MIPLKFLCWNWILETGALRVQGAGETLQGKTSPGRPTSDTKLALEVEKYCQVRRCHTMLSNVQCRGEKIRFFNPNDFSEGSQTPGLILVPVVAGW